MRFAVQFFARVGFHGNFAVARDVIQMVADAAQAFGFFAVAARNLHHHFGMAFGGCGKVAQSEACFDAFALGGQFNVGRGAFFGINSTRGEAEKPVVYVAVQGHGFAFMG